MDGGNDVSGCGAGIGRPSNSAVRRWKGPLRSWRPQRAGTPSGGRSCTFNRTHLMLSGHVTGVQMRDPAGKGMVLRHISLPGIGRSIPRSIGRSGSSR